MKTINLAVDVKVKFDEETGDKSVELVGTDYNTFEFFKEYFEGNDKVEPVWSMTGRWRFRLR